jgi:predicted nuclease of predicted toxin-antitoxin system
VRLLLDEHLPPQAAAELRRRGHDVVAVVERPDLLRASDDRLWTVAHTEGRGIVTQDVRDFVRLAARETAVGLPHPGLILIHHSTFSRGSRDIGRLSTALDALLVANPTGDALTGRVVWLRPPEAEDAAR